LRHRWFRFLAANLIAATIVAASLVGALAAGDEGSAEVVHFPTASGRPNPLDLSGYLRRPNGEGPFPAVVLLHGCGGHAGGVDRNWGALVQSWGYVSLTLDSFAPRGIQTSCHSGPPAGRNFDLYGALQSLSDRSFVDSGNVALMGFSEGGLITLF
jgi:dienelactone hydrolase